MTEARANGPRRNVNFGIVKMGGGGVDLLAQERRCT